MIRIRRAVVVGQVTRDASRVRRAESVVAVHMALRAEHRGMRPGEGKTRGGVVKRRIGPRGCGVALQAGGGKARLHVVGTRRLLEIRQVATDTRGVGAGQIVVAVHVAQRALHRGVRASKRKPRVVVIECGICPGSGVVALGVGLREP